MATRILLGAALAALFLAACGSSGSSSVGNTGVSSATPPPVAAADPMDAVRELAVQVREMADDNEVPLAGSPLEQTMHQYHPGTGVANCVDFAMTLIGLIQTHTTVQARELAVAFSPDAYDSHSLVEVFVDNDWRVVDPEFALIPHNTVDDSYATADDMRVATRAKNWSAIRYEWLTDRADFFVRRYYLDYPLVFEHTYNQDHTTLKVALDPDFITKFYVPLGALPPPGAYGVYALQCAPGAIQATSIIDGVVKTFDCNSAGIAHTVKATTDEPQGGEVVLEPQRFVFPWDGTCNILSVCS